MCHLVHDLATLAILRKSPASRANFWISGNIRAKPQVPIQAPYGASVASGGRAVASTYFSVSLLSIGRVRFWVRNYLLSLAGTSDNELSVGIPTHAIDLARRTHTPRDKLPQLETSVELLLKDQRRAADSISFEIHRHFNAVGNLDEGNAAIHPVVFTVKGHCPGNLPVARPFARNR